MPSSFYYENPFLQKAEKRAQVLYPVEETVRENGVPSVRRLAGALCATKEGRLYIPYTAEGAPYAAFDQAQSFEGPLALPQKENNPHSFQLEALSLAFVQKHLTTPAPLKDASLRNDLQILLALPPLESLNRPDCASAFEALTSHGVELPPVVFLRDHYVMSDGYIGSSLMVHDEKTGWHETYIGGGSDNGADHYAFLNRTPYVAKREKGWGEPRTDRKQEASDEALDEIARYYIDKDFIPFLKERTKRRTLHLSNGYGIERTFAIAGLSMTKTEARLIVEETPRPEKGRARSSQKETHFPLKTRLNRDGSLHVIVKAAFGKSFLKDLKTDRREETQEGLRRYGPILEKFFGKKRPESPYYAYTSNVDWQPK